MNETNVTNYFALSYRLLSHGIQRFVLNTASLPPLLRNVRGALFPNNIPGKSTLAAPSSDAELRALRRKCANHLWALVPKGVGRLYFGGVFPSFAGVGPVSSSSRSLQIGEADPAAKRDSRPTKEKERRAHERHGSRSSGSALFSSGGESGKAKHYQHPSRSSRATNKTRSAPPASSVTRPGEIDSASDRNSNNNNNSGQEKGLHHQGKDRLTPETNTAWQEKASDSSSTNSTNTRGKASSTRPGVSTTTTPVPAPMSAYLPEDEEFLEEIEGGILDVFSDAYCNKHLIYGILELLIVRLMPELAEKGVLELWAERIPVHIDSP